jgi:hypothetical protein
MQRLQIEIAKPSSSCTALGERMYGYGSTEYEEIASSNLTVNDIAEFSQQIESKYGKNSHVRTIRLITEENENEK